MKFQHTVTTPFTSTLRDDKITAMFSMDEKTELTRSWDVDFPIENSGDWSIGLIIGPSGAGKTTLAKQIFGAEAYHETAEWAYDKSIASQFAKHLTTDQIIEALSKVGLSSPPNWRQPFHTLSNGQKFRAELARVIAEAKDVVVFDEFTSVVDREVAKITSAAVSKLVRKSGKKFVAVSCHDDIVEWLQPDWVYQVDANRFSRGSLQRPQIQLDIRPCSPEAWQIFREHHYLNHDLRAGSECHIGLINGRPAAFTAAMAMPHATAKGLWREHRTVCLPDYQGVGIGNAMSNAVAQHYLNQGFGYRSVTTHPAMVFARMRDPKWVMARPPSRTAPVGDKSRFNYSSSNRLSASFEYIGDGSRHSVKRKK